MKKKPRKKSSIAKELASIKDKRAPSSAPKPSERTAPAPTDPSPLRLEWRSPDELAENPANWRRHPTQQIGALSGAISEVGWAGACLYNERTKRLIDGHARRKVAIERGETKVPVLIGSWTEEQERKILASLDPLSAMAVADPAALASLLCQVDTECAELQAMLDALAAASPEPPAAGKTDPDEVPEVKGEPVTKAGDLWVLGGDKGHRLLCGDSTDGANVALAMNGDKAVLMNTDAPYGVCYDADNNADAANAIDGCNRKPAFEAIGNDELTGERLQDFLERCIRAAVPFLDANAAFYLWHPMLTQGTFFAAAAAAAAAADILIHRQIIWVKPHFIFGRGDYHWKHELCFYGWVKGNRPPWYGERNQDTVWTFNIGEEKSHPSQKPVELFTRPMLNHTKPGEIVYEPFAGSGSQIISAQANGRRCYAQELHPPYVDLCLRRWADFTGLDPVRESDGAKFSELVKERDTGKPPKAPKASRKRSA